MSNVQVVMSNTHSPLLQEMCNIRYYRNKKLKNSIKGLGGELAKEQIKKAALFTRRLLGRWYLVPGIYGKGCSLLLTGRKNVS